MVYSPPITATTAHDTLAQVPGVGPGAQVMTDAGEVPVEWLATGDRVVTRDHGLQPVLWIGHARFSHAALRRRPGFAPYQIAAQAFGPGRPSHPSLLAPQTRVLLSGWEVALHSGTDTALAEIGDLGDGRKITRPHNTAALHYSYIVLPMHELVHLNGIWVETPLLDRTTRAALDGVLPGSVADRPEVIAGHRRAAHLCLASWEVAAILGAPSRDAPARNAPARIDQVA